MVSKTSESLRDDFYNDFANNFTDPNYLSSCLILSGLNRKCRKANLKILDQLPEEFIECKITINA